MGFLMKKALIIEDNDDNMELLSFILESNNYKVIKAYTGLDGIKKAVSEVPDFILLDIQLPDIDGLKVIEQLRSKESCRNIKIIAVTSYAMAGDREKMLAAGCHGYIEKPIDPDIIISQIKSIIGV
jgi:two-component system, cell cycle response regulator DivK